MSSGIKKKTSDFPLGNVAAHGYNLCICFPLPSSSFPTLKTLCRKGFHCQWETKCTLPSNSLHAPRTCCPLKTINKYILLAFYMKNTRKSEKCGMNLYSVNWMRALQLCQYPSNDGNVLPILIWVRKIFFRSIRKENCTPPFSDFSFKKRKTHTKKILKMCEYVCKAAWQIFTQPTNWGRHLLIASIMLQKSAVWAVVGWKVLPNWTGWFSLLPRRHTAAVFWKTSNPSVSVP